MERNKLIITATFLLGTFLMSKTIIAQQKVGTWGDQGNGRYKNPILESNYPNNDVIKQGDTYYMMSSNKHFTPGMVILKSKDLVNWEFSNHIMPAPIKFDKGFEIGRKPSMDNLLVWASGFGYNGEKYFAYWCHNRKSLPAPDNTYTIQYATAKSMEGPWSEPEELKWPDGSHINTTDPGLLWDFETHKAWISLTIKGIVKIFALSWDGTTMLEMPDNGIEVTKQLQGESNKIYKFDDNYYVMNSHVRQHEGHLQRLQIFNRAKHIEGPWEGRIVMEDGNGTDRSPSQGTLLKLDNGTWWFIHQLAWGKPENRYLGRPQFLETVTWKDGWPLIGTDTDNDDIGEVVWENNKPINGFPITAPASDDDFASSKLGMQWEWKYNPKMERWSLTERPGFLRLKSCISTIPTTDAESLKMLPNLIGQRLMGRYKNVMTAKIDVSNMANGQEAGLHISANDNSCIGVKKNKLGQMNVYFKSDTSIKNPIIVVTGPQFKQKNIWLRSTVENGIAKFFYSLDGKEFNGLGGEVQLLFSGFTANNVGFYSKNTVEKGFIDVDWFKYDYDGPKGK